MQNDALETVKNLQPKVEPAAKWREEALTALRHHAIEVRTYRAGLDQFDESAKTEIGRRLATEERRLVREAVAALEHASEINAEMRLALSEAASALIGMATDHRTEDDGFQAQLADLKDRSQALDSILGE